SHLMADCLIWLMVSKFLFASFLPLNEDLTADRSIRQSSRVFSRTAAHRALFCANSMVLWSMGGDSITLINSRTSSLPFLDFLDLLKIGTRVPFSSLTPSLFFWKNSSSE